MGKEWILGILISFIIFLFYLGVQVGPILIIGIVLSVVLFFALKGKSVGFGKGKYAEKGKVSSGLSFDDIGGQNHAKEELMEALDFLLNPERIKSFGIRPIKGILLTGPPGTGKTLLAKAAANYTNSAFVSTSGSEFVEMYVGVGASRIRQLFQDVKEMAQKNGQDSGIIFIDEIDVLGGKREGSTHREYDQTLNQLLTEMDGMSTSENPRILIMAATNRIDMLDPALIRPGRFDRQISVGIPDRKGREQILQIHLKNKPLAKDVSIEKLSKQTFGFSGAQLESLTNEAAIYAMREGSSEIESKHFNKSIDKVLLGEKIDRETSEEEKRRVAIHELGHAFVTERLIPGSVSQIALTPRSQALGYVRQNPPKEQYLYTKEDLEFQIMIALAGTAAEEVFFRTRSTGASNDLEKANYYCQQLIATGLSSLGFIHPQFIPKDKINEETNRMMQVLFERVKKMIEEDKELFEYFLEILLQEEWMSGDEMRERLSIRLTS
ncbi:AAA family ATPase [Microaerobacter geothermalis]|uniref:AAA family ATPase n=1 Tax=Microaerobacter geothermalis TaxID=674972 RepID=UPI001F20B9E3|nr:AAA family ATPase [Microaerobacter geothermalis]MCF6093336.1 AAA family ATPase [Microaerobacter geothermalis]